jgi:hypothetical protein
MFTPAPKRTHSRRAEGQCWALRSAHINHHTAACAASPSLTGRQVPDLQDIGVWTIHRGPSTSVPRGRCARRSCTSPVTVHALWTSYHLGPVLLAGPGRLTTVRFLQLCGQSAVSKRPLTWQSRASIWSPRQQRNGQSRRPAAPTARFGPRASHRAGGREADRRRQGQGPPAHAPLCCWLRPGEQGH